MENLHTPPDALDVRKQVLRTQFSRAALGENQASYAPAADLSKAVHTPVPSAANKQVTWASSRRRQQ